MSTEVGVQKLAVQLPSTALDKRRVSVTLGS